MSERGSRPRAGILASLPMSLLLLVLFFVPWLKLSCDPSAIIEAQQAGPMPNMPVQFTGAQEIGTASGWQLARGDMTTKMAQDPGGPGGAKKLSGKTWVYGCLALPILLLIIGGMGFLGMLSPQGAGKGMLLLGIVGVVFMLVVTSVDYVDDMFDKMTDNMPAGFQANTGDMAESKEQMRKVLITETTPWLWVTLGLYGLIAGCGLKTLSARAGDPRKAVAIAREEHIASPGATTSEGSIASAGPVIFQPDEPLEKPFAFGPDMTPSEPLGAPVEK